MMVDTAAQQHAAELFDDVKTYLARFVVYPSPAALIAHTLWILHTWFMHEWESTPRIAFLSPEPASGKSRALEVTEPLVPRPVHAVNASPAYLFRKVSDPDGRPTILFDEIDTIFGPKAKDNEDIRGMLNAGHRKGAVAGRCVIRGKTVETEELPAYAAVALAGLDDLPDTIMTRSVVVRMRRRLGDEKVEPWRRRINGKGAEELAERIDNWSSDEGVRPTWPDMPPEIQDRDADVWEALLAVADLAGHAWATTARDAAKTIVAASRQRKPSVGVLLLADLQKVFNEANGDRLTTVAVLSALNAMAESPWPTIRRGEPIDARSLANRLGKYGIGSKTLRRGSVEVFKGYARSQFEDAWTRYVPIDDGKGDNEGDDDISEPPAPVERNSAVTSVTSVAAVPDVTAVTDPNLHARAGCHHRQMTTTAATNGHHQ
ncbi:DUF3631 domain-containing protein [Mycobacterium montefiorense]|uniref:DUF3631 domain-containing protein n=2 Tax=Mycobacterium montefiorense TaxID=154654 RepID=UPI0027E39922|nr:DUF3631 domain-containing protein [Mycobacterium montefiorense]MCV7428148.1 DUF3631 domain-containing protein [Mycobacterium montefiorense]